jgi:light-regulated signal transduction histidine kinase (bacteriophytochrome)
MGADANAGGVPQHVRGLWLEQYRRSRAEGRFVRFEYEHPVAAGACWLDCCVNFLGIASTGRPRFSYIAEDVTDRKRNEELLQRSNLELRRANADLEQFAYSASHDLQEPLRQIAVYSQLLEKKFADRLQGKGLQYLGYCIEGAHRMEMLISGLLEYSQVSRPSDSPAGRVNVAEVLEIVKKNLATTIQETGAEVTVGDLPTIHGHPAPLVHLFQNLVSNALKYRGKKRPRASIAAAHEDGHWRFSVEDNGIGIAPEFQTQIFGIFKRLHDRSEYPGTGIGLAICQKIVERSGGRIWVESELGRGSTFFFTLPRASHGE